MTQTVPDTSEYVKEALSIVTEENSMFDQSAELKTHHSATSQLTSSARLTSSFQSFASSPLEGTNHPYNYQKQMENRYSYYSDWSTDEPISFGMTDSDGEQMVPGNRNSTYSCDESFAVKNEPQEEAGFTFQQERGSFFPNHQPHSDFKEGARNFSTLPVEYQHAHPPNFLNQGWMARERRTLVPADPLLWRPRHVRSWLSWVGQEYGLHQLDIRQFAHVNGKGLCAMELGDFIQRTSHRNGEVLMQQLTRLKKVASQQQNAVKAERVDTVRFPLSMDDYSTLLYREFSEEKLTLEETYKLLGPICTKLCKQGGGQIQLWQFLMELLSDQANSTCISWEGSCGEFKMVDPDEVARRWGERKSKPNMNYDKMSRALRYYYDKNIMTKVHGKRYAYKFDFRGLSQALRSGANADRYGYQPCNQDAYLPSYKESMQQRYSYQENSYRSFSPRFSGQPISEGEYSHHFSHGAFLPTPSFENNGHSWSDSTSVLNNHYGQDVPQSSLGEHSALSCDRSFSDSALNRKVGNYSTMPSSGAWKNFDKITNSIHINVYDDYCATQKNFRTSSQPESISQTAGMCKIKDYQMHKSGVNTYHYAAIQGNSRELYQQ